MRILHVIHTGDPGGGACTKRMLASLIDVAGDGAHHEVLVIGAAADVAVARRCGLEPLGYLCPPRAVPWGGRAALRRLVEARERASGPYDIIHAWSGDAVVHVCLALPKRSRLATIPIGPCGSVKAATLMTVLVPDTMPLLALSSSVRRDLEALAPEPLDLSVIPPGVDPALVAATSRRELRGRWGVADDTFVIGVLSEPACWADARVPVDLATKLGYSGRDLRVVLHPCSLGRAEAERFLRSFGAEVLMIQDAGVAEPWRIVAGLDAALVIGGPLNTTKITRGGSPLSLFTGGGRCVLPMPGIQPLLWAMAAGLPVVAESSPGVLDVLEDGRTGLCVPQHDRNAACRHLARLHDDRGAARRLGAAARAHVEQGFTLNAYSDRLHAMYADLLETRASSDAASPTAGTRPS